MHSVLLSKTLGCVVFALTALLTSFCYADTKEYPPCAGEPTESDVSAAKGAYEAGEVSFQEADYDRAILYWEDAFRRDCTAVKLLLNLARAYELSGDKKAAVNALETYLDRRPEAANNSSVEKRIENLKASIAEEEAASKNKPKAKKESAKPVEGAAEEHDDADDEAAEEDEVEVTSRSKKPIWPVIVTGVGVAIALTGHAAWAYGESLRQDEAEAVGCDLDLNECPSDAARDQANEAGRDERRSGNVVAAAGHVVGLTGGILWWILWSRDSKKEDTAQLEPQARFLPVLSPSFQGVSFSGTF